MYKNKKYNGGRGNGHPRFNGRFPRVNNRSRGNNFRNVKVFNPSSIINTLIAKPVAQEYTITRAFSDFKVTEQIKRNISEKGYQSPTPIQDQSIGHILEGRDLIGIANTGTGKTAAFLIPLIDQVFKN